MTTPPLTLTPKTTVHTLLKEYPFLLDFLAEYHPEFKKLTNPVLRRTVGRMATLDTVAEQGNVPLNQLIDDIADGDRAADRHAAARSPTSPTRETIDPARLEALHAIVKDLHAGKTVEEVKPRVRGAHRRRGGHRDRRHGAEAHRGRRARQRGQAPLRRARAGVRRRARGPRGGQRAGRPPDGHLPAREPGAAAGHGVAAQGRGGDRRAAGRRRLGAPQGRPAATPWSGSPRSTSTTCARRTSSSPSSRTTAWRARARSCGRSTTTSARSSSRRGRRSPTTTRRSP